jgi:hypothetical protein
VLQLLGDGAVRRAAIALACAMIAGCAAPARSSASLPAAASAPGDPHAQIEALDREIGDALGQAQLAPPEPPACVAAACAAAVSAPFATSTIGAPACRPATSERCTSACTLATSICDNQRKICDLARALAGDDWAAHKCEKARASCTAAHEACCGCAA